MTTIVIVGVLEPVNIEIYSSSTACDDDEAF